MLSATVCSLLLLLPVWTSAAVSGGFVNFTAEYQSLRNPARLKRQTCSTDSFICKSGQCIDFTSVCDGKADCKDSSDETRETCNALNIPCPPYAFRCDYGGCVDGDARCDGKFDCADRSDEMVAGCKTPIPNPLKPPSEAGACKDDEFRCDSGQCVSSFSLCDGTADCSDKSDETARQCQSITCPGYTFRCAYGACVDGGARCDGTTQCADGSDEDVVLCGGGVKPTPGPVAASACVLPAQPADGRYSVKGCDASDTSPLCRGVAGTPVSSPAILSYSCSAGYVLDGAVSVLCFGGNLAPEPPTCRRATCPSLGSNSVAAVCKLNGQSVACNAGPSPVGTVANLACQVSYQLVTEPGYDTIQCTESGQWTPPPFSCTPVCGTRNPDGKTFVSNGVQAKVGEFPWVVAVYRNSTKDFQMKQICGGSLVSLRLVVSAAHCFWNDRTKSQLPKERFKMAIGKYYRDWDTKEDELQVRDAADIRVHERYQGRKLNFANDIAVIKLNVSVELTWAVRPVCVDWKNDYERFQFVPGTLGAVAGWGITEEGVPSTVLATTKLPFVDFYKCWNTVPESFQSYVTTDKFCAGYTNGTSVCPGDSGSGLAFEQSKLWYLRGIVSVGVSPEEGSKCYTDQYTAFTTISKFLSFIKEDHS